MRKLFFFFLFVFFIAGCGLSRNPAKTQEFIKTVPVCYSERECEMKWSSARRWVIENARYKIQTMTPDFIETYNPSSGSPSLAVRVTKEPIASGGYRIIVKTWCDNVFGCGPDSQDAEQNFNNFVNKTRY